MFEWYGIYFPTDCVEYLGRCISPISYTSEINSTKEPKKIAKCQNMNFLIFYAFYSKMLIFKSYTTMIYFIYGKVA
jgi:hypothetical protein